MHDLARQRFASTIENSINEKKRSVPCPAGVKRDYAIAAKITRYDEGSKFGRLMLAGVGAMHIDGDMTLTDTAHAQEPTAELTVQKTFAWGGIYGASTSMEDIEPAFAEAVANAIVAVAPENTATKE